MNSRTLVCVLAAASMTFGSLSFAQGYDRNRGDNNDQGQQQRDRGDRRGEMGNRGDNRPDQYQYGARGAGWQRGGHIPPQYRQNQYVVNDWRGHHLNAPPRGYHWVQVGGDYVLIAIATGIIAQLLLSQ